MMILAFASSSLQSHISMRRSIWSDDEFYAEANWFQRIQLARDMSYRGLIKNLDHTCEIMRAILSRDGVLNSRDVVGDTSSGCIPLWSLLCRLTAWITRCECTADIGHLSAFKAFVADMLPIVKHSHESETLQDGVRWSLDNTLMYLMRIISNHTIAGVTPLWAIPRYVEVTLLRWLKVLEAAGVDLQLYGEREVPTVISVLREEASFFHDRPKWFRWPRQPAHLCCLQYGSTPADWKLWWREPSDEFVGEFWATIEYEVPRLPGSWVDDEDTDCET